VFAYATLRPYFDTVSVEIDGKAVGAVLDAYATAVLPSGPIEVSSGLELTKGQHRDRFTVIGTNSASLGHGFGIDSLELRPWTALRCHVAYVWTSERRVRSQDRGLAGTWIHVGCGPQGHRQVRQR